MRNLLKELRGSVDIFGQDVRIHIFGHSALKTNFTLFISILALLTNLILGIIFTSTFFQKDDVNVVLSDSVTTRPTIDLSRSPMMFALFDINAMLIRPEKTYSYQLLHMNYTVKNMIPQVEVKPFTLEKCDRAKHYTDISQHLQVRFSDYLCLPYNDANIVSGRWGDAFGGFEVLQLTLSKCNPKYHECYNETVIDDRLTNVYMGMILKTSRFDHKNYTHPVKDIYEPHMFNFDSSINKRHTFNVKHVIYKSDYGLVFEDVETSNHYIKESSISDIFSTKKSDQSVHLQTSFGEITIAAVGTVSVYFRTFQKLQELLASFGGVVKGVMVIAKFIVIVGTRKVLAAEVYSRDPDLLSKRLTSRRVSNLKINNFLNYGGNSKLMGEISNNNLHNQVKELNSVNRSHNNINQEMKSPKEFVSLHKEESLVKEKEKGNGAERKVSFSNWDMLCPRMCISKTHDVKMKAVEETEFFIKKEVSLENMLLKFHQVNVISEYVSRVENRNTFTTNRSELQGLNVNPDTSNNNKIVNNFIQG